MIRTKVILVFTTSLFLIAALLGVHIYQTSQEVYLHKRLESMQHEYALVLDIKYSVSRQVKEAMDGAILGFSKQQSERYDKVRRSAGASIKDLIGTISNELDYIFSQEKEHEEGEKRRALDLHSKYKEIDEKLEVVNKLVLQETSRMKVGAILAEIDELYDSFVAQAEEWVAHEEGELQSVQGTFVSMTNRNTMILIAGAIITLLFAMTMSLSIILLVVDPRMKELISGTKRVAKGDLGTPIALSGNDEFTALSRAFNQMMVRLQSSQKQLLEQSYYSGMAEMVSGILHNIKNAFAPFIVDTEIIYHHVKGIKLYQIGSTFVELRADTIAPDRKNDLLDLGGLLYENSQEALKQVLDKLAVMQNRAALIERIIEEQSELANSQRLIEEVSLHELIYDSLSLIKTSFLEDVSVVVLENVQEVGTVNSQRIILLQVFKNVILNAIESVLRCGNESGEVQINAEYVRRDGRDMIHITITDNGEGIKKEGLQEIFQRGVSGKLKSSGLGLHWCANSLAALQGHIYAESSGLGKGAQFHIFLKRT